MRYLTWLALILVLCHDATAQWESVYPISSGLKDVAVAEPSFVFLLSSDNSGSFILKSTNAGRTWKRYEVANEDLHAIFFQDSLSGYVVSYTHVYKTSDGCRSWQKFSLPETISPPSKIFFTSQETGYIRSASRKIVKSTDGGKTWKVLANSPVASSFSFSNDRQGYAISNSALYKTGDGGDTWDAIPFLPTVQAVFAVDDTVAYATASFSTYRTTDAGAHWAAFNAFGAAYMNFTMPDSGLFFTDYSEILKTTDGGQTFVQKYHSKFTWSWKGVAFSRNFGCAIGSDNTIVTTEDGGATWKLKNIRLQLGDFRDVHFTSDTTGFVIGNDRGLLRTDDDASSWYYDEDTERDDFYDMAFSDADTGIFIVTNNYAYRTYDGGKTMFRDEWSPPIIGHEQSHDYEMVDSRTIYTVGVNGNAAKTMDGGKSWQNFEFSFTNALDAIKCLDQNVCHAAGLAGMLISTWDGGAHWKIHDLPLNNDLKSLYLLGPLVGFAGGSRGTIVRTEDGGQTWSVIQTEAVWTIISFQFISDTRGYAISEGGEVLRTNDGGKNWRLWQKASLPGAGYYTFRNTFMRDTASIYGITQEGIYRCSPHAPPPPDIVAGLEPHEEEDDITIFPNPSSGFVEFSAPIDEATIIDMRGAVLKRCKGELRRVNIAELGPGMYLIRMVRNSNAQTQKVIKR